jgi:hypothetical protein
VLIAMIMPIMMFMMKLVTQAVQFRVDVVVVSHTVH